MIFHLKTLTYPHIDCRLTMPLIKKGEVYHTTGYHQSTHVMQSTSQLGEMR